MMRHEDDEAVREWMRRFALPAERTDFPDPTHVWVKAEMLRRWDAQRKAMTSIEVGERIQVGVQVACAVALVAWFLAH